MKIKQSIIIGLVVIVAFALIIFAAESVGLAFGKAGENAALVLVAVILAIGLYKSRKEEKSDKKKKQSDK